MNEKLQRDSKEAARAVVHAYYYGSRKELDAAAEHLRSLLGWDSFGDDSIADLCDVCDCGGQGWEIFNEDPDTGYLGEVQACDTCLVVANDDTAAELASLKGYVVTLRDGRWEVDALPLPTSSQ